MVSAQEFQPLDVCETSGHLCGPHERFCSRDGSRVVQTCQNCTQRIGEWRPRGSPATGSVPQHCFNCGAAFPWVRGR